MHDLPWQPPEHFHRFVVATDFGAMSQRAFAHGLALALRVRGRLELLQVDGVEESDEIDDLPRVRDALYRWGRIVDPSDRSDVYSKLGLEVDKRVVSAEASTAVVSTPREPGSLLILATDGPDGWLHDWQTLAVETSIDAGMPVLLVPAEGPAVISLDGRTSLNRVLVAVTEAPGDEHAILTAMALCRTLGFSPEGRAIAVAEGGLEALALAPPAWTRMVRPGDLADAVANEARGWQADVVVVRRLGAVASGEPMLGTHGDRLLGGLECPVLIVP